ncbi:hypothetical protein [Gorillibacterium massiliense]|uniref:hypothetical protein n=1 Tax=Gorillibacterium massiliense TaxID=1280390 RepID=UPI0004B4A266|nr:hypothetical protein [Gorillibacterium massiliense]
MTAPLFIHPSIQLFQEESGSLSPGLGDGSFFSTKRALPMNRLAARPMQTKMNAQGTNGPRMY